MDEDEEDGWPREEHRDLKRIGRRLEGGSDEQDDESGQRHQVSDVESSASGSLYEESDHSSSDEERGRSRTPVPHPAPLDDAPHPNDDDDNPEPTPTPVPSKGPQSWIRAWPLVSPFFAPDPPFAFHLAQQFLHLLGPTPASGSQVAQHRRIEAEGDDSDSAEEVVGGYTADQGGGRVEVEEDPV